MNTKVYNTAQNTFAKACIYSSFKNQPVTTRSVQTIFFSCFFFLFDMKLYFFFLTSSFSGKAKTRDSRQSIISPDWNFEKMGIGGLDKEFSDIFRRAFASRVFPPDLVEQMGECSLIPLIPSSLIQLFVFYAITTVSQLFSSKLKNSIIQ